MEPVERNWKRKPGYRIKAVGRKIRGFVLRNWFWTVLGCVLTRKAVETAYLERGYMAVGGEWLVLPVILMTVGLVRDVFREIPGPAGNGDSDDGEGGTGKCV